MLAVVYARHPKWPLHRTARTNNTLYWTHRLNTQQDIHSWQSSVKIWFHNNIREPFLTTTRVIHISIRFLPLLLAFPLVSRTLWYRWLTSTLQALGPCFIKLGQWASTRIDILPNDLCTHLQRLHSNVAPHSWQHTEQTIIQNWHIDQDTVDRVFSELDKKPIGCGSIAQVYYCKLNKLDGRPLCLKILHPGVKEQIDRDLKIVYHLANWIDYCLPQFKWISLPQEVLEFNHLMNQQLDLRLEAINLAKFNHNFANWHNITFPKPILSLTTKDILVEEFCYGIPMQWFLNVKNNFSPRKQRLISEPFINSFLKMMIVDNFTHTDLHPGNIIITTDDNALIDDLYDCHNNNNSKLFIEKLSDALDYNSHLESNSFKICLIDCGLVTQFTPINKKNFMDLFIAMSRFDGKEIGKLMIERSRTPETAINAQQFIEKVGDIITDVKEKTFTLGTISVGQYLQQMFNIVSQHHVKLESDFVSIMVAIFLLEGIGRQLDSSLDLFDKSTPFLEQYALQNQIHKLNVFKLWIALKVRKLGMSIVNQLKKLDPT